ncbi:MAG TPA: NAD-dependent epimerase/dehydratase family protein [Bacteroidales bacterium]|jgi:nucleoside-diphosphate-sugar epimerase|nr:NAD-dependent epimerase/dehydratase family protein [Bacteroidales bacterium]|tara:strand:- start:72 stop:1079 length:1008 start_codon:yes stop_codon:yes gene_type:complete
MILVTGGTGLVGSHLVFKLAVAGETPVVFKRSTSDILKTKKVFSYYTNDVDSLFNKIKWIDGDISDFYSVLDAMEGISYVYHTAAIVSFQSSDKESIISANITGTKNIVNAALEKDIKKLVHISSIGVFGRSNNNDIVTEETHWNAKKSSAYSTSKYHAEMEVWRGISEGLNAVIVNPSVILGPGNWDSGSSKLFSTMYNGLKFYSMGSNGFVDVKDVVEAMIILMKSKTSSERYILNSENVSYKQLFFWMADSLDVKRPKYKATKFISEIVWRILWTKRFVTGKKSAITKETAETSRQIYNYSNDKFVEETAFKFISIKESINKNAKLFLSDQH